MYSSLNARALGLDLSAAATIELASAHGFGGVDLLVRDLVERGEDPGALRARMDALGLRGGAFPLPVHWRGDRETFDRDFARLPALAETAAQLGLLRTGTWVLPATRLPPAEAVALHCDRLGKVARILDGRGIRLGLEAIGAESFRAGLGAPFVTRLADLDRVLGTLRDEAPNLGIVLDGFHLYAAGEMAAEVLARGVGRIVCVHVADLPRGSAPDRHALRDDDRGLPDENGAIDSRGLLMALRDARYEGPVIAEPLAGCRSLAGRSTEATVRDVAEALHAVWPMTR